MTQKPRSYIARSALASFLLEVAQTHERGIRGLTVDFADNQMTGYNWRVTSVDPSDGEQRVAEAIVRSVVYANSCWVMVEDGSPLDGDVERPKGDWLSRLTTPRDRNSRCYIARSALASFLLELSQSYEAGIAGLEVDFADEDLTHHHCNWIVTRVDAGMADPFRAHCVVATVERVNSGWVMVEDGSELDGRAVERSKLLH